MTEKIDHKRILDRYWELAKLEPDTTKGNITGQLKALESLNEELRRAPGKESGKPAIYRSAWMPKQ